MSLKIKSNAGGSVELQVPDTLTTDETIEITKGFTGTFQDNTGKTVTVKDGQIVSVI